MTPTRLLRPRILYGLFTVAAFLVALRFTFPAEAVKERLIYEAGKAGWQVDVQDVRPGGLLGVRMDGVTLTDAAGLKLPIDELETSLRVLPLLVGKRTLDYRAAAFDGTVEGVADLSGDERRLQVDVAGVNLGRIAPLRKATGVDLTGAATGTLDLTLPAADPTKASGTVELSVARAGVTGGSAVIPPFSSPMAIPALSLGTLSVSGKAEKGRLALDRLELRGGDAELTGEGVVVVLQQRIAYAPLAGKVRLRFAPSLWQKPATGGLKGIVEQALLPARTPDGSYQYQLYGSLSAPQARPAGAGGGGGGPPPPLP